MMKDLNKLFQIINPLFLKSDTNNLKVLAFHSIDNPIHFEKLIVWLSSNFNIISLDQLNDCVFKNSIIPKNPLLITFDDGDISVYNNGVSILKKYDLPAVLFVITDLIDTKKPFWWNEIKYYLDEVNGNKKVWEVKKWPNKDRELYIENLRKRANKPRLESPQLTSGQLREMQASRFTIANHSHTHPMFNKCSALEIESELTMSINRLTALGFSPEYFAYPNGNFSLAAERKLQEYEIKTAFLFDHKINNKKINPLRISRLIVNDTTPLWKFKLILSGLHSQILPFVKVIGKLKR